MHRLRKYRYWVRVLLLELKVVLLLLLFATLSCTPRRMTTAAYDTPNDDPNAFPVRKKSPKKSLTQKRTINTSPTHHHHLLGDIAPRLAADDRGKKNWRFFSIPKTWDSQRWRPVGCRDHGKNKTTVENEPHSSAPVPPVSPPPFSPCTWPKSKTLRNTHTARDVCVGLQEEPGSSSK